MSKKERESSHNQDELNAISRRILAPAKRRMTDYLLALEARNPGSRVLFAGTCEHCEVCAKVNGCACKYPDKMRYSIESLGGNVALAAYLYYNDTVLWAKDGYLPEYYILIGGLLTP